MKKFYLIRKSSDPEVIGVENGVAQASIDRAGFSNPEMYDELIEELGSFNSWETADAFRSSCIELQSIIMLKNAKLTDFMSYSPFLINSPFLISKRAYEIIREFEIHEHLAIKSRVDFCGSIHEYFLFHYKKLNKIIIDYKKSLFFIGNSITGKVYLEFTSAEDEEHYIKSNNVTIQTEKLVLNSNLLGCVDFLVSHHGDIFISDKLKAEIEKNALTGVNLLPAYGDDCQWPTIGFSA